VKKVTAKKVTTMMSCEQFELSGLDVDRADAQPEEAAAATEHAANCARCFAMLESWRELKQDLRLLQEHTRLESAPARVEMRLKQELRTRREARVPRSTVAVATWALAAAAALAAAIGWMHWRDGISRHTDTAPPQVAAVAQVNPEPTLDASLLTADYDTGDFTQLPGSMPTASSDESVLQARVQRGALVQFGLPVAPEQATEWVDVDFLVGEDGQPLAVRLHQDASSEAVTQ
jgi:hypothetical protein